jgi:hypothetical protein
LCFLQTSGLIERFHHRLSTDHVLWNLCCECPETTLFLISKEITHMMTQPYDWRLIFSQPLIVVVDQSNIETWSSFGRST